MDLHKNHRNLAVHLVVINWWNYKDLYYTYIHCLQVAITTPEGGSWGYPYIRASDRSRKKKSNFAGFLGTKSQKNRPISQEFCGNFWRKLGWKAISKKRWILWLFSGQISLEIDRFCADQTSIFNVFLTEVIICSFNNNTLQKWTNGKAFNIMASAQFFATQSTPGSFRTLFAHFNNEVLT